MGIAERQPLLQAGVLLSPGGLPGAQPGRRGSTDTVALGLSAQASSCQPWRWWSSPGAGPSPAPCGISQDLPGSGRLQALDTGLSFSSAPGPGGMDLTVGGRCVLSV